MFASVLRWIARFAWGRLVLRNPWFARIATVLAVGRWFLRRRSRVASVKLSKGETMVVGVRGRAGAEVRGVG